MTRSRRTNLVRGSLSLDTSAEFELNGTGRSRGSGSSAASDNAFVCFTCGRTVDCAALGTRNRNHCPHCLWSVHLDVHPGDRRCLCRGAMAPIAVWMRDDGEGAIIHRCTRCGELGSNRIAGDDNGKAIQELIIRTADLLASLSGEGGQP